MKLRILITAAVALIFVSVSAQEGSIRGVKQVLNDLRVADFWFYEDFDEGLKEAEKSKRPLLVTIRCVPCKACAGMDKQVVNPTDPELLELMKQFVCVRIVQVYGLDLSLFQYDMNMSWAAFFLNADKSVYGRYGTRAAQRNEAAITVSGFKKALRGALDLHQNYLSEPALVKDSIRAKLNQETSWSTPESIRPIRRTMRWGKPLGLLTGKESTSCIHCHFVPAGKMMSLMSQGSPITDSMLWSFPFPETVGLTLDPAEKAMVQKVRHDSPAGRSGFRIGDRILVMDGQPILSIADVQWVLHGAEDSDRVEVRLHRSGLESDLILDLPSGWRRKGRFDDRASSWDFFKVKILGIAQMTSLPLQKRKSLGLGENRTALRIDKLTPSWADMNGDARKVGLKELDIIVEVDGRMDIGNFSGLLAYLVQEKKSGDQLNLTVLRKDRRLEVELPLNWEKRIQALRSP